jgi:hypothetical protein
MSKRLDLVIEEKEGTRHQAALVIGGMKVINTGIGCGWIGQGPSSGFCDLTPATLGVFASLDRF